MPVAIVRLSEEANRVINIVKAKYGLKDKSEAINQLVEEFEDALLESKLKPSYVKKMQKIEREHFKKHGYRKMPYAELRSLFGK